MARISLGFQQWQALEPLYDYGSPVHIETLEHYPGNIVDVRVTYFAEDERTQRVAKLTADGDLVPSRPGSRLPDREVHR